ncbi:hypothetical protein [Pedobacter gandavensis]|uniref:Uncharacterized protein n=1 Tax=Pedobacter gandavensis TaxID=2679963 RepID=A0ABR6EV60_9SPHI|nr:hypothetical protein [Pedobacter gandavensis]MBB2149163.1 hypothetical protein [Pedobacter gandavensis]
MAKEETLEEKITRLEAEKQTAILGKTTAESALKTTEETHQILVSGLEAEKQTAIEGKAAAENSLELLQEKHSGLLLDSSNEIARLSKELDSAKSDAAESKLTTTVDGQKYQVVGKSFNVPGKGVMTVFEILKDKALLKDLVNKGVGFIIPTS